MVQRVTTGCSTEPSTRRKFPDLVVIDPVVVTVTHCCRIGSNIDPFLLPIREDDQQ